VKPNNSDEIETIRTLIWEAENLLSSSDYKDIDSLKAASRALLVAIEKAEALKMGMLQSISKFFWSSE